VEAAEAFDGDDGAELEKTRRFANGLGDIHGSAVGGKKLKLRPTIPAGVGLRVETAIGGIVIFDLASGTHFERVHGGAGAVVGNIANDGEARAAVGAVDEGIAKAAVARVGHFAEAVFADGDIGRDEGGGGLIEAGGNDAEGFVAKRVDLAIGE